MTDEPRDPQHELTRLIEAASGGDASASDRLLHAVYDELRRLASKKLAREAPGQTLQATALVHEAWLRVQGPQDAQDLQQPGGGSSAHSEGRAYFFAACAEAMRRILVERARARGRLKRGGDRSREPLEPEIAVVLPPSLELLALDEALTRLEGEDPRKAKLVKLRYFAGMTLEEAALALAVSRATAERDWAFAKAFLYHEVKKGDGPGENLENP